MEPLAAKIRPRSLADFVGQQHLVGKGKPLAVAIEKKHIFSFILWGPPGVGKTTLARLYAQAIGGNYYEFSAVSTGKDDIRKVIEHHAKQAVPQEAQETQLQIVDTGVKKPRRTSRTAKRGSSGDIPPMSSDKPTILFLDEIHRFNKAQQDFLLPYVESGELVLIGATTENPSFEVISALLSRCQVFVLNPLSPQEMSLIIDRCNPKVDQESKEWLVTMANGDARQAISVLEHTAELYKTITVEHLRNTLQNTHVRYDKKAEEHYNTISAFIKSMRASQPNAALYYLARMVEAGEDPKFIARRMVIFASEDIGLADPQALTVANNVFRAVEIIGYPECAINLSHGVCYLALAPKSKASYYAYNEAVDDVRQTGNLPIPLSIRNAITQLMKDIGYGEGYEKYTTKDLLPDALQGKKYLKKLPH